MEEGIATISSASAAQRQAAIQQQLSQVDLSTKEKDTAFILELVLGVLGLLGIGYMYTGLTNAGIVRLIGYWIFLFVLWSFFGVCATVTLGIGLCAFPIPLIVQVVVAYFSADDLKKSIEAVKSRGMGGQPAAVGGYIAPQATIQHDPLADLRQDLYPGIEAELEQDRLDKEARASQRPSTGGAAIYPETPAEPDDEDEGQI